MRLIKFLSITYIENVSADQPPVAPSNSGGNLLCLDCLVCRMLRLNLDSENPSEASVSDSGGSNGSVVVNSVVVNSVVIGGTTDSRGEIRARSESDDKLPDSKRPRTTR